MLGTILKIIKNWKAFGEDNIPSEQYKYGPDKLKIILLNF
jgi:hypothetical protein